MKNSITNRQFFFIIIISSAGFSTTALPRIMLGAGTGAWFVMILGAVFFCLNIFIITYLGNKYKGMTLFEYSQVIIGKKAAYLFGGIYALYFLILLAFIIRTSADVIKSEILYKTPILATIILVIIISLYAASKGLTKVGRILEFLGTIILIIGVLLYSITFSHSHIMNIMPLFELSEMNAYLEALPFTIYAFLGFEIITCVAFTNSNGTKSIKTSIGAIVFFCLFNILTLESCYGLLGIDDIANYDYPLIAAIRRLDIHSLQFAKRLDLFFIIIWLLTIFCSTTLLLFAVKEYASKLAPRIPTNILWPLISIAACLIGLSIPSAEEAERYFIQFVVHIGLIPAFVIPLLLFTIHLYKNRSRKHRVTMG